MYAYLRTYLHTFYSICQLSYNNSNYMYAIRELRLFVYTAET